MASRMEAARRRRRVGMNHQRGAPTARAAGVGSLAHVMPEGLDRPFPVSAVEIGQRAVPFLVEVEWHLRVRIDGLRMAHPAIEELRPQALRHPGEIDARCFEDRGRAVTPDRVAGSRRRTRPRRTPACVRPPPAPDRSAVRKAKPGQSVPRRHPAGEQPRIGRVRRHPGREPRTRLVRDAALQEPPGPVGAQFLAGILCPGGLRPRRGMRHSASVGTSARRIGGHVPTQRGAVRRCQRPQSRALARVGSNQGWGPRAGGCSSRQPRFQVSAGRLASRGGRCRFTAGAEWQFRQPAVSTSSRPRARVAGPVP